MYAAFDKNSQTITLSNPVIVSGTASFQGNSADTSSAPSYTWVNDTNTGIFHPGDDAMGMVTAGAERMRIISTGNVGIGTTTPSGLFQVRGSSTSLTVTSGGNVGIGTANVMTGFSMQVSGYPLLQLPIAILEERQSAGFISYVDGTSKNITDTNVPTTTTDANTWRVRNLKNFVWPTAANFVRDSMVTIDNIASFSLQVGTYHIYAEANAIAVGRHRIALTSTTSSGTPSTTSPTIELYGTSEFTYPVNSADIRSYLQNPATVTLNNVTTSKSTISGFFTVTDATRKYRIQHYTNQNSTVGVFGLPGGFNAEEVYMRVIITRYL